jgi:diguanylate cyclase (GGDEF)-like protein
MRSPAACLEGRAKHRPTIRQLALLALICLAVSTPFVLLTVRSVAALGAARKTMLSERRGLDDERILVPLVFDAYALRAARLDARNHSPVTRRALEERVSAEGARAQTEGTASRIDASECRPFSMWLALERRARSHPDPPSSSGDSVEDATCYTLAIANSSGIATDDDPVVYDYAIVSAMSGAGLAGRAAQSMALFEVAAAAGFRRGVIRAAGSIGYVTRDRGNVDDVVADLSAKSLEALRTQSARADLAERRFETGYAAALEPDSPAHDRAAAVERLGLAAARADRQLAISALGKLDARLARANGALGVRLRATIAMALLGLAFTALVVIIAAYVIARRHRRQFDYLELERRALEAKLATAELQRSLSLSDGQMRAIFDTVDVGLAVVDSSARVTQSNGAFATMRERFPGLEAITIARCAAIVRGDPAKPDDECSFDLADGNRAYVTLSLAGVYEAGICRRVVATVTDVTDAHRLQESFREASLTDALTGLANRRGFEAALAKLCAESTVPFALFYLDLDYFKTINDVYGHATGDAVLRTVGARLRENVAKDDVTARLGGDEFALIVHDVAAKEIVDRLIARVVANVERPIVVDATTIDVSISVGVAMTGDPGARSPEELLARADAAMYETKRSREARGGAKEQVAGTTKTR